jgi:4-hydroxy-tetrahydrodipicolinate synthase
MKKFYGTGVALVTPFNESLEVDYKGLKKLLSHTSKAVDYFVVMGTTGESVTVKDEEKNEILKFVIQNNSRKLPVVFGIGGNSTEHVITTIKQTDFNGVDGLLSVSPYYNKPSQEGIYQHFRTVADESPVPVILYNVPGRTGSNLTADTTLRLANHKNIAAIKEASGNLEQCMHIMKKKPKDFLLISGDDMHTVPLYSMGSKGVISVLANAFPGYFRKMKDYAFKNEFEKASREQFKILEINPLMYEEGNPVGVKYLLSRMGVCEGFTRLPMASASESLKSRISLVYQAIKGKG